MPDVNFDGTPADNQEPNPELDGKFAELAVAQGLVTSAQVNDAVEAHRTVLDLGLKRSLSEIMVEKGLLTQIQAETVRRTAESDGSVKIIGGFELLNKLGEGGMGVVYKAKQLSLDRVVALKILPERLAKDREYVARFMREARVGAKLDHVNVVRALDVGEANGMRYFAMELVEGENLGEILDRDGKMPEEKALAIMIQSARALEHAHQHQLIHRDIKPDNILVTPEGVAKIADLGLARSTDSNSTRMTVTGVAMGTPHYISPEQARGESDIDIRTDIYSLGVTFFHTLSGHPPFQGSTAAVVLTRRLTEDPPWIRDVVPEISEGTALVIKKMMARDRTARYTTPKDLLHDLELVADGKLPEIARGETATAQHKDPARSTGVVPIVSMGERPAKKGLSATALTGIIGGAAVIVLGVVLAVVLGRPSGDGTAGGDDQNAPQVFKIMSDVQALQDSGKIEEAIAMVQTAASSFGGTAHAQKFATRLSELERAKEREVSARDHLELIQKLADVGNKTEALEAARKGKDKYAGTSSTEGLAEQLAELEKWSAAQEASERELQTAIAVIDGLEKEGAFGSALTRAQAAYEKLKDAPGSKKLADVIERLEKKQGGDVNTAATTELTAIQDMTAKGNLDEALRRATAAATKYALTPTGKTLAETRDNLKTLVAKQSASQQLSAVLQEGKDASDQKRFDDAINAYERALKLEPSSMTKKLLLDARIDKHLAASEVEEEAGNYKAALDQVNLAITLKPTPAARSRRDALKSRMVLEDALTEARALEKAGNLDEARKAYTRAMKGASPTQSKQIQDLIDGLGKKSLDTQAQAELDEVKALYAKADFDAALMRASAAAAKFSGTPEAQTFKKIATDAKRELEKGKENEAVAATISDLLKNGAQAAMVNNYAEAADLYDRAAAMKAPAEAQKLVVEAKYRSAMVRSQLAEKDGKLAEAIARVEEAAKIKAEPETAERLKMLQGRAELAKMIAAAHALETSGEPAVALEAYRKLPSGAPEAEKKIIDAAIERLSGGVASDGPSEFTTSPSGIRLAFIPAGTYLVGDSKGQKDERPARRVALRAFHVSVTEITNVQYARYNPRYRGSKYSKGGDYPAIGMTWRDAVSYCNWLSKLEKATYRLPTEAEWEVAARGTDGRTFPWGNEPVSEGSVHRANWGKGDDPIGTRDGFQYSAPVGSFPRGASPYGCLDMAGNVWEWCADWYGESYYAEGAVDNPTGPAKGDEKVVRGGSWFHPTSYARSANRFKLDPRRGQASVGFRVVCEVSQE